jgi:hypothetical protein
MKKSVQDNTLELKDRQKEKALNDISTLTKDFLSKFISEYAQLKKKENDIEKDFKKITVNDEIKGLKEKLQITSSMIEKSRNDIETLNSEIEKIDIGKMKEELAENIKSALKIKASIS